MNQFASGPEADLSRQARALREECVRSAAEGRLPLVDAHLDVQAGRLSTHLSGLVDHVALLSHQTTRYLRDLNFDGPVIMLGRDATPVAIGVAWCAQSLGLTIPLRMIDISNKFLRAGWDSVRGGATIEADDSLIPRLCSNMVTPEEAKGARFWKFFEQAGFNVASKCLLIDNGINGTLLGRLNEILLLCNPGLEVHNSLLYYTGAVKLPRVTAIVEHRSKLKEFPTKNDLLALARFSRESVKLEGWPHPYPSLSHFESRNGKIYPAYQPSETITSEGRIEARVDWNDHAVQHLKALRALRQRILS